MKKHGISGVSPHQVFLRERGPDYSKEIDAYAAANNLQRQAAYSKVMNKYWQSLDTEDRAPYRKTADDLNRGLADPALKRKYGSFVSFCLPRN